MNLTLVIYFQIYYLPFMILCLQVQKRASSGGGLGFHGLVEAEEATVSMEIPLLSNHQHSGGESVQLDGLPAPKKEDHQKGACSYSFSSNSNPLMVQLYLQIDENFK